MLLVSRERFFPLCFSYGLLWVTTVSGQLFKFVVGSAWVEGRGGTGGCWFFLLLVIRVTRLGAFELIFRWVRGLRAPCRACLIWSHGALKFQGCQGRGWEQGLKFRLDHRCLGLRN